jgi:hypothetical protein
MFRTILSLVALTTLLLAAVACGGDVGDDKPTQVPTGGATEPIGVTGTPGVEGTVTPNADALAIEELIRRQTDANNAKDIDGFVASFSDSYYSNLGVSREEARDLVSIFIGIPQVEITGISGIEVGGETAIAEVRSNEGVFVSRELYAFTNQDGRWLVEGVEELPVDPGDARIVELQLTEYSFEFDEARTQGGGYAFNVSNAGTQPHEIELMQLPAGVTAADLTDRENVPAGVVAIGLFGPLDAGEQQTLVFAGDLPPGNYALVDYLSTETGQSNAQLGMVRDFIVE